MGSTRDSTTPLLRQNEYLMDCVSTSSSSTKLIIGILTSNFQARQSKEVQVCAYSRAAIMFS